MVRWIITLRTRHSDRLDLGTNVLGSMLVSTYRMIRSSQNSEQTVVGWLEDEDESYVDEHEDCSLW
jgi:hypothetical protein